MVLIVVAVVAVAFVYADAAIVLTFTRDHNLVNAQKTR